jgi:hypothetical protein
VISQQDRYGIELEVHTLCRRHAYNPCDGHGGNWKPALIHEAIAGRIPISSEQIAQVIRNKCANATVYVLKEIPREVEALPKLRPIRGIRSELSKYKYGKTGHCCVACVYMCVCVFHIFKVVWVVSIAL